MRPLQQIVGTHARHALDGFESSGFVRHPGEGGRAREGVLADFFRKILPGGFGVGTGFVTDVTGALSGQTDIVIYRTTGYPVLDLGGVQYFPVEAVVVVIESKARIASKKQLAEALDQIASVKRLDRTNSGSNRDARSGVKLDRALFVNQVYSAVVFAQGLRYRTALRGVADWCQAHDRDVWPSSVLRLKEYRLSHASGATKTDGGWSVPTRSGPDPTNAQGLTGSQPWGVDYGLLAALGAEVLQFLCVATPVTFPQHVYFQLYSMPYPDVWTIYEDE